MTTAIEHQKQRCGETLAEFLEAAHREGYDAEWIIGVISKPWKWQLEMEIFELLRRETAVEIFFSRMDEIFDLARHRDPEQVASALDFAGAAFSRKRKAK